MYLLDANAFMEAKRLYYSFRIAPGFWQWLTSEFKAQRIASISAVHDEIAAGDDDLADWAKNIDLNQFWLTGPRSPFQLWQNLQPELTAQNASANLRQSTNSWIQQTCA